MSETNDENVEVNNEAKENAIPAETPTENQVEGTVAENTEANTATIPEEPQDHEI